MAAGDPDMLRAEREAEKLRGKTCGGCDWCLGADESGFMLGNVPDARGDPVSPEVEAAQDGRP